MPKRVEAAKNQEDLLHLLAEAIDCREDLTSGSSRRVRDHATRFAQALSLSARDRGTLERGALLRDIGKLRISNCVLLKFDLLTHAEWDTIHQHTHLGGDLVKKVPGLADIEGIVRRHHECWDGTGYPDGLEGNAIPYLAQIMRILDVYCAMTSRRLYRKGVHSHKDAIAHLKSEAGKQFNPELVKVFVSAKVGKTSA
jgi:putative two-component system response regulator